MRWIRPLARPDSLLTLTTATCTHSQTDLYLGLRALIVFLGALMLPPSLHAEETVMEVITLQNRPIAEIQPLLTPLLDKNDVVSGSGFNLIVKTSPGRLESILALLEQLDTRQHNLLISVLQNSHKTAEQLNAELAIAVSPAAVRLQGMGGDTRNTSSQHATQQLRTLEGQAAHIQTGQQRPVEQISVYDSGYGYAGFSSNTQMQEASNGFAATPRLVGNNEVIIDITPWSDRFIHNQGLETQSLATSVRARLGQWVDLGASGISEQTETTGFNGINARTSTRDVHILMKIDLAD